MPFVIHVLSQDIQENRPEILREGKKDRPDTRKKCRHCNSKENMAKMEPGKETSKMGQKYCVKAKKSAKACSRPDLEAALFVWRQPGGGPEKPGSASLKPAAVDSVGYNTNIDGDS